MISPGTHSNAPSLPGPGARGEYWIDVDLGGHPAQVLIDTGLIDARGQVGFSVEPTIYDQIKQSGGFRNHQMHARLTADGQISNTESGLLGSRLLDPQSRTSVGPIVDCYVFRGASGVPSRVGMAFFHLLKGCKVHWDLDQRLWCIECP
jgi:hypothetical protein